MEEYKSFEERYLGREKPLGKFLRETRKTGYGTVAGMFRVPTTIRKSWNKQTRIQRGDGRNSLSELLGTAVGYIGGLTADFYLLQHTLREASHKNYTPAIAFGLTNFASLWYEIGRRKESKSKSERIYDLTEEVEKE